MKKFFLLIMAVVLLFNFIGCQSTEGNTGDAVNYFSPTLRKVIPSPTNSKKVDFNIEVGDICKYGEYIGHSGDPDGWDAIGAIFGGDNYTYYIHVKQHVIENCVVWESLYTTDNMSIQLSEISSSSCTNATTKSLSVSAEKEGSIKGSASYNYTSSSATTVEFAKGIVQSFDVSVDGLDTDNYQYARAILADVEIIRVYKLMQTVEWFQTKTYCTYEYTYVRISDKSSLELVMLYKEIDYK